MKIYLYDKNTGLQIESFEALTYTDEYVEDLQGAKLFHGADTEYSTVEGEMQGLRQAYRQRNPSESSRLAQVEELLAALLYGGDSI